MAKGNADLCEDSQMFINGLHEVQYCIGVCLIAKPFDRNNDNHRVSFKFVLFTLLFTILENRFQNFSTCLYLRFKVRSKFYLCMMSGKSAVWNFFKNMEEVWYGSSYQICMRAAKNKGSNMSNVSRHLRINHPVQFATNPKACAKTLTSLQPFHQECV